MVKLAILFYSLFFMTYATAGIVSELECKDVDIRETNPQIKNNPKLKEFFSTPRNQDSIGWCYGFAAADLISAEVGEAVSAADVSNTFNEHVQNNFFLRQGYKIQNLFLKDHTQGIYEGGYINWAIKQVIKKGTICREDDLPFDQDYPGQFQNLVNFLEETKQALKNNEITLENACAETAEAMNTKGSILIDFKSLSILLTKKSITDIVSEVAKKNCQENPIKVPQMRIKKIHKPHTTWGKRRYFTAINNALEAGKPVGLDVNVKGFTDDMSGPHAVSILARRWKNGRCEYKIRNSWGNDCSSYKYTIDCDKDEGSFWFNDEDLQKYSSGIYYKKD